MYRLGLRVSSRNHALRADAFLKAAVPSLNMPTIWKLIERNEVTLIPAAVTPINASRMVPSYTTSALELVTVATPGGSVTVSSIPLLTVAGTSISVSSSNNDHDAIPLHDATSLSLSHPQMMPLAPQSALTLADVSLITTAAAYPENGNKSASAGRAGLGSKVKIASKLAHGDVVVLPLFVAKVLLSDTFSPTAPNSPSPHTGTNSLALTTAAAAAAPALATTVANLLSQTDLNTATITPGSQNSSSGSSSHPSPLTPALAPGAAAPSGGDSAALGYEVAESVPYARAVGLTRRLLPWVLY